MPTPHTPPPVLQLRAPALETPGPPRGLLLTNLDPSTVLLTWKASDYPGASSPTLSSRPGGLGRGAPRTERRLLQEILHLRKWSQPHVQWYFCNCLSTFFVFPGSLSLFQVLVSVPSFVFFQVLLSIAGSFLLQVRYLLSKFLHLLQVLCLFSSICLFSRFCVSFPGALTLCLFFVSFMCLYLSRSHCLFSRFLVSFPFYLPLLCFALSCYLSFFQVLCLFSRFLLSFPGLIASFPSYLCLFSR